MPRNARLRSRAQSRTHDSVHDDGPHRQITQVTEAWPALVAHARTSVSAPAEAFHVLLRSSTNLSATVGSDAFTFAPAGCAATKATGPTTAEANAERSFARSCSRSASACAASAVALVPQPCTTHDACTQAGGAGPAAAQLWAARANSV